MLTRDQVMDGIPEMILEVHARNVKLDSDVDLTVIARGTPTFSGADLAAVMNEAALLATAAATPSRPTTIARLRSTQSPTRVSGPTPCSVSVAASLLARRLSSR